MSHKLKLSLDQNTYDLENIQSSDALAYLKDPTTFHASPHLTRNVNLTNLHITRVKPRPETQNGGGGGGGILHSNQSQDSPNSAQRFSLVTSPAEASYKTAFRASPENQKPINNPKDRVRFKSLEVEELSHIAENQENFTCPICYCDYDESSIVTLPACHHKFCKECMHNYIKKQMNEFQVLRIQCPQDKCEENLPDTHLKDILDKETYEAYQSKKMLKLKNKDIYLRYCPKPGCTKPFYPDNKTQFTVCSCGTTICHGCFHQKHDGKTCLEATAGEFELFVDNEDLKACMVCKTVSEKRVGCSHVVCPVCDYEWCWNCGREWEPGHGSRCLNKWSPRAPKAFEQGKSKTCFETFLNAVFLIFEIIGFFLSSALVVIVIWPCMMSGEIEKNLLQKKIKSPCFRRVLALIMAFISWPVAIILYPTNAVIDEYGGSCRRRRWKKGTSANFGFGKQLAEGRKKFALSGGAEPQAKSQPHQESRIEGVLSQDQEKMEEIDLEALEHIKSDPHPVAFQRNRSKMNTSPLGLVSNHMIASEVDLIVQNHSPDSTRPIPNLLERRQ